MPDATPARWPRMMRAATAAEYLDVSPSHFRTLGIPCKRIGAAVTWDRRDLDAYLDGLPHDERRAKVPPSPQPTGDDQDGPDPWDDIFSGTAAA